MSSAGGMWEEKKNKGEVFKRLQQDVQHMWVRWETLKQSYDMKDAQPNFAPKINRSNSQNRTWYKSYQHFYET